MGKYACANCGKLVIENNLYKVVDKDGNIKKWICRSCQSKDRVKYPENYDYSNRLRESDDEFLDPEDDGEEDEDDEDAEDEVGNTTKGV